MMSSECPPSYLASAALSIPLGAVTTGSHGVGGGRRTAIGDDQEHTREARWEVPEPSPSIDIHVQKKLHAPPERVTALSSCRLSVAIQVAMEASVAAGRPSVASGTCLEEERIES